VVAKLNALLYRTYPFEEYLRIVFHVGYDHTIRSLHSWLQWEAHFFSALWSSLDLVLALRVAGCVDKFKADMTYRNQQSTKVDSRCRASAVISVSLEHPSD